MISALLVYALVSSPPADLQTSARTFATSYASRLTEAYAPVVCRVESVTFPTDVTARVIGTVWVFGMRQAIVRATLKLWDGKWMVAGFTVEDHGLMALAGRLAR